MEGNSAHHGSTLKIAAEDRYLDGLLKGSNESLNLPDMLHTCASSRASYKKRAKDEEYGMIVRTGDHKWTSSCCARYRESYLMPSQSDAEQFRAHAVNMHSS